MTKADTGTTKLYKMRALFTNSRQIFGDYTIHTIRLTDGQECWVFERELRGRVRG